MSRRLQRLLPLLVLVPVFAGATAGAPAVSEGGPVAPFGHPTPHPRPAARAPEPTVGELASARAIRMVGVPYRWGGASPETGFDCSGLVYWAYGQVGISVPHSSYALYSFGQKVARSNMKPGDVLVFEGLGHVGLYLGGGRMVHAPETGRNVEVVKLGQDGYGGRVVGARRITAA